MKENLKEFFDGLLEERKFIENLISEFKGQSYLYMILQDNEDFQNVLFDFDDYKSNKNIFSENLEEAENTNKIQYIYLGEKPKYNDIELNSSNVYEKNKKIYVADIFKNYQNNYNSDSFENIMNVDYKNFVLSSNEENMFSDYGKNYDYSNINYEYFNEADIFENENVFDLFNNKNEEVIGNNYYSILKNIQQDKLIQNNIINEYRDGSFSIGKEERFNYAQILNENYGLQNKSVQTGNKNNTKRTFDNGNMSIVLNNYSNIYNETDEESIIDSIAKKIIEYAESGAEGVHI